ncbi:precorrin-2 C(20)-methyltransferase [Roseomonas sp. NAR14]|uniref:Precorrin-2 C(20)-methyltransferase n=2 Tax=Roseomonas acroporae TaxID=2937791 RepID=A0A9X1Y8R0_9PROT|nr:precorrin-2 C(20)-methyltransferase [Roseomonas acroporae]
MGPGDPELLTLKAARIIRAAPVVACFSKRGRIGHARRIAGDLPAPGAETLSLEYPYTTEIPVDDPRYLPGIARFYEECAETLAARLSAGLDVALLCEGDPFLYGSAMYLFDRLRERFPAEVVPGVSGMSGCWSRALLPMTHGDDVLAVLPGTLDRDALAERLRGCDAAVIMKVGRNLPKIRAALADAGLAGRAVYVERGTMAGERVVPLDELPDAPAPYFALVLVPGRQRPR